MKVLKRNGSEADFAIDKIKAAIKKANNSVAENNRMDEGAVEKVIATVQTMLKPYNTVSVEDIQDIVEKALMRHNKYVVAKSYILYREEHKKIRENKNPILEQAITLMKGTNDSLRGDNANKKVDVASSMRDYLAGLVCKDYFNSNAPKDVVEFHKSGKGHFHDADYSPLMPLFNCDLLNTEDMLDNGTQMGDTHIGSPKLFSNLGNLYAQFNLIVSGSQYGGQTISWAPAAKYVQSTRDYYSKIFDTVAKKFWLLNLAKPFKKEIIEFFTKLDVKKGIKTYQYQVICHQSSNGQTPFVSNNLNLREAQTEQEQKDLAMIIEMIFKRRIKGVKDSHGETAGPLFPKLLYWMCDGLNLKKGDPYFYLTELAAKCNSLRCQPDINSEKICREIKHGQVIPSMGCRSLLSAVWEERKFPIDTKFCWQYIDDSNIQFDGAPNKNFNFKRGFEHFEKIDLDRYDEIVINFRGNSGWVKSVDDKELTIIYPFVYGRFNSGVVTTNIPHAALRTREKFGDKFDELSTSEKLEEFFKVLDNEYLSIARKGLIYRTNRVKEIKGKNIPIHLMYGAITRMGAEDTINDWIKQHPKAMSTSFGFIGLYETCRALISKSNTTEDGQELCKKILEHINEKINEWSIEDGLNYSLYGTPEESLTAKAAAALKKDFGLIPYITDKDYVVNSYHVDPREHINAMDKIRIEGQYLSLCPGGAVSYIETGDLRNNLDVYIKMMQYMYDHIVYAEFNRLMGKCYTCGFEGVIPITKTANGDFKFKCPKCGEDRDEFIHEDGRICGYNGEITAGNTNKGRLDDITSRTLNFDLMKWSCNE